MGGSLSFWEKIRFLLAFGVWPDIPTDPLALTAKQEVVDSKLRTLALEFAFADQDERHYQGQITGSQAWDAYQRLKNAKRRLRHIKKAFWKTHRLAKRAGFRVRKKFGSYLTLGSFYEGGIPVNELHIRPPDYRITKKSVTRLNELATPNKE